MSGLETAVREFHARAEEAERVQRVLGETLKMAPESELFQATRGLIGGYIMALDAAYQIGDWLEWWWSECALGARPMGAAPAGGSVRMIATVDDLVALLCEDAAGRGERNDR
ncbi:MAG: hypothetical protein JNM98_18155 [Rhodocyclaceae bacterium]|nr:hypothetical protein [Rhodocyclaceae bacterium]